jgi:glycogenin glucosyltransferase
VSQATLQALHPAFCTRILAVEPIAFPPSSKQVVSSHVDSWDIQGTLTKLHIFRLDVYDTILYLDADCLVVKDVSHLLELGKVYIESEALIAAAPDIFPPDKFNAGVMVVRPSHSVFDSMMAQASLLTSYDGGDTGFLNAYFAEWYTDMPPRARLPFGYNAQRFLYHCTHEKQPNYWDTAVDLHVIHYSSSPKPWATIGNLKQEAQEHLGKEDVERVRKTTKSTELEALWRKWYRLAGKFAEQYAKNKAKEERQAAPAAAARQEPAAALNPKEVHTLVTKRYKELRREGKPVAEAMAMARSQYGLDKSDDIPAATQVATMFGMI